MARVSFTLKKIEGGSRLQLEPPSSEFDNDSALRGDAFGGTVPVPPEPPVVSVSQFGSSTFTALPTDYGVISLQWNLGMALASTLGADIVPTQIVIKYSTLGEPMNPTEGTTVTTISPGNETYEFAHSGLPQGAWIYYSLFARYESSSERPYYERVASISVLMPKNYKSTDLLWARIPEHYRIQDSGLSLENEDLRSSDGLRGVPGELIEAGPLYRMLSSFGWEMDRVRTLTSYLMRQKDPDLATPEVLDALSEELGININTRDLGSNRLRNIIGDIRFLREYKGTYWGTQEWLTAITGCPVFVHPLYTNLLTTQQSKFTGTVTTTTNGADVPTGNEWVIEGVGISRSTSASGVKLTHASGGVVTARTRITDFEQALWHRAYLDATGRNNAQIIGYSLSTTPLTRSSVTVSSNGSIQEPYPDNFVYAPTNGSVDWYQIPSDHGVCGDGTLTTVPTYFNVLMYFTGASSSLTLNNAVVHHEKMDPYKIDIFSQRANLVRDPQFTRDIRYVKSTAASTPVIGSFSWSGNTTNSLWSGLSTSSSVTFYETGNYGLGASTSTGSSVMFVSSGASISNTPVLLGLPYFASVDDPYDVVVGASLVSRTYGLIRTTTEVSSSQPLGNFAGGYRKCWSLGSAYTDPWLPRELSDCYVVFHAVLNAGESVEISRPLFEALTFAGEYFDGDTVTGGWLQTPTLTDEIRDHRWGDAGAHISFSYYTSDYQRTRNVVDRVLPSLIPVTQDTTLDNDDWNRLFGYSGTGMP